MVRFRDEDMKSKETSSGLRRHNYQDFPKCISYRTVDTDHYSTSTVRQYRANKQTNPIN